MSCCCREDNRLDLKKQVIELDKQKAAARLASLQAAAGAADAGPFSANRLQALNQYLGAAPINVASAAAAAPINVAWGAAASAPIIAAGRAASPKAQGRNMALIDDAVMRDDANAIDGGQVASPFTSSASDISAL